MSIVLFFLNVYGDENSIAILKYINKECSDILYSEGEVSSIIRHKELPILIPEIDAKERIINEIKEIDQTIGVEILLLFKTNNDFFNDPSGRDNGNLVTLYNILQSISSLKGIEYYSASRERMRIFYHDAYVIDSPEKKVKRDDPVMYNIPGESVLFAYFKDSSFGKYVCHVEYFFNKGSFLMEMENVTQIWYFLIPLIDPYKLKSYTIIIPLGDEILFYGFSCLHTINAFGIAESRIESLYYRIKAIYNWFQGQYALQF